METLIAELGLNFSDGVILIAVVLAAVKVLADYRGWTRSPALVRQENADLRERNATLEADVRRLDKADRENRERIAVLEEQIRQLEQRDQAAVLSAVAVHEQSVASIAAETRNWQRDHEQAAQKRADESLAVLREIRDLLQPRERST